jgi:3-oxoacyl-[acyl-carrier protein] reductase
MCHLATLWPRARQRNGCDGTKETDVGKLDGKVALITGAGRGIGRAIARGFGEEGARLAINDIDGEQARATAGALRHQGVEAIAVPADVSREGSVAGMVRRTIREFSRIDVLVNNAGVVTFVLLEDMATRDWDRVIAVHLRGTFLCTRYVLPHMLERRSGKIINIASQRGQKGGRALAHYAAAKAGILGFTKSVALEVARRNVHVNAIAPGPIAAGAAVTPQFRRTVRGLPIGRPGTLADVVPTAVFLASRDSDFYVGQTLCPNGGDVML